MFCEYQLLILIIRKVFSSEERSTEVGLLEQLIVLSEQFSFENTRHSLKCTSLSFFFFNFFWFFFGCAGSLLLCMGFLYCRASHWLHIVVAPLVAEYRL